MKLNVLTTQNNLNQFTVLTKWVSHIRTNVRKIYLVNNISVYHDINISVYMNIK